MIRNWLKKVIREAIVESRSDNTAINNRIFIDGKEILYAVSREMKTNPELRQSVKQACYRPVDFTPKPPEEE
jgi:hypothetical protein